MKKLEDHNFRVNSESWKKITVDEKEYLENPEADIWEILDGEERGEQLFTFNSAKRETAKAGKTIPTDDYLAKIIKTKKDMPNPVFSGYRDTDGWFHHQSSFFYLWSCTEFSATYGWSRYLNSGDTIVYRYNYAKTNAYSVRCLNNN